MKIAQIAPLYESVPPRLYGGTERIVAYLVDALVDLGHDVTLFASGDSKTKAQLVNCRAQAIWLDDAPCQSDIAAHINMLDDVRKRAHEFDILHFHLDLLPLPLFDDFSSRTIITLHGRLDIKDLRDVYQRWPKYPLVSISDSQREPLASARWAGTIYHGLPLNLLQPTAKPHGDYLVFLGRFSPEKQPDVAIKLAQRLGKNIKVVGKIEPTNICYFRECLEPLLKEPNVDFLGEMGDADKSGLLSNAEALLFPVNWPEPFGIVMIEAMACGTPVVAWNQGSVREVIEHGVTGFVVNNEQEAITALQRVKELDRKRIRTEFERRFSAPSMAQNYLVVYEKVLNESSRDLRAPNKAHSQPALDPEATAQEAITVESDDSTMPYKLLALKDVDTFAVANGLGDIVGKGDGLFRNDTRVLSELRLQMGGKPLSLLSGTLSQDDVFFTAHITNRPLPPLGESAIPEGIIHVERSRFLWRDRLYERLQLVNYGERAVAAPIELHFSADFHDIFEVRGHKRKQRGDYLKPRVESDHVVLSYRGLDKIDRQTVIAFSHPPHHLTESSAEFRFSLPRKATMELFLEISSSREAAPCRERFRNAAAHARVSMRKRRMGGACVRSSERIFGKWLEKSRSDLALLTTDLDTGPYPYAGIPWFSTPFGRDAVITALEMLWIDPRLARGVLKFLAQHQAREYSSFRDAAPGKVMHETRKGEMSRLGEVPFSLYYGGVDTTPLFVMLAGAYAKRTADMSLINDIWPALEAAMVWIEETGDANGDGFLDYQSAESTGLRNQGWKDSEDSIFHKNGEFPKGPIALVEVQGYKFGAMAAMKNLARRRGDTEAAHHWKTRAKQMQTAVEHSFWMEDQDFYALAMDGKGELCQVRASNAGHLLYVGLPSPSRAAKVTQQLLSGSFNSGWGIRTLATDEARYNPMSYHNGSVWPHDTALCVAGMARYGERTGAAQILAELFNAAIHFDMRLPELFCGFQRLPGESPVAYPVACLPQAWSSGAVFMALQACLGITIDGWRKEVHIHRPELPDGLNHVVIKHLRVGDTSINLVFQRVRDRVTVFTEGNNHEPVQILTQL